MFTKPFSFFFFLTLIPFMICAQDRYTIIELPMVPGYTYTVPMEINENGTVAGRCYETPQNEDRLDSFIWNADKGIRLIKHVVKDDEHFEGSLLSYLNKQCRYTFMAGLNDRDQIVGYQSFNNGLNSNNDNKQAFIWSEDKGIEPLLLEKEVPGDSFAFGINNREEIVGTYGLRVVGNEISMFGYMRADHALEGQPVIQPLNITSQCQLHSINNQSQAVGLYKKNGKHIHLIVLDYLTGAAISSEADALFPLLDWHTAFINDQGVVATTAKNERPIIWWSLEQQWKYMDTFGNGVGVRGTVHGLNNVNQVVGHFSDPSDDYHLHAFVWDEQKGFQDLNRLIDPRSGWTRLQSATSINDKGEIVGWGLIKGKMKGFLLIPQSK
jgi:uncharacterized membrane protein